MAAGACPAGRRSPICSPNTGAKQSGVPLPDFTIPQILAWADSHHAATGRWPTEESGPIPVSDGVHWSHVRDALRKGRNGRPGGSSLPRLLAAERGMVRHPQFTIQQILGWADSHQKRTGQWPTRSSGRIPEAPEETWFKVASALRKGQRGLAVGLTLSRLFSTRQPGPPEALGGSPQPGETLNDAPSAPMRPIALAFYGETGR